jgi:hypothetical protein
VAAHQHCWILFALELHGDCGDGRTVTDRQLKECAWGYSSGSSWGVVRAPSTVRNEVGAQGLTLCG